LSRGSQADPQPEGSGRHFLRNVVLQAQIHGNKTSWAGRRVQRRTQPDEARRALTPRPNIHNHYLVCTHGFNADADWLRAVRGLFRLWRDDIDALSKDRMLTPPGSELSRHCAD